MIFRRRNLVFLFAVAAFVCADQDTKQVQPAVDTAKEVTEPPQPAPSTDKPTPTTEPTKPTTVPTTAPTTASTTPSTPTPAPTTSPTPPTTSTTPATPPTSPPTPPTKPTTPPTPPTTPTTPTPAPTTPTPAPTTPTPAPTTPAPAPVKHDAWIVKGANDTICIVAKMDILVRVPYQTIENKTVDSKFTINKVDEANATGSCYTANNTETLVLTWHNATTTATFNFFLNGTGQYSINSVQIAIQVNNFTFPNNTMTNVTQVKLLHHGDLFSVGQNNSFSCAVVPALNLTGAPIPLSNNTLYGHLVISNVHVQAFGQKSTSEFRAAMDCAATETPDIVPIVVGLILAGLVVVVLVAYLVGRRRARNNGYLSM